MTTNRVGVLLACLLASAGLILAQGTTATISGTVSDSTGAVMAGVKVTATNIETNVSRTVATANDGGYSLLFLPIGT